MISKTPFRNVKEADAWLRSSAGNMLYCPELVQYYMVDEEGCDVESVQSEDLTKFYRIIGAIWRGGSRPVFPVEPDKKHIPFKEIDSFLDLTCITSLDACNSKTFARLLVAEVLAQLKEAK